MYMLTEILCKELSYEGSFWKISKVLQIYCSSTFSKLSKKQMILIKLFNSAILLLTALIQIAK